MSMMTAMYAAMNEAMDDEFVEHSAKYDEGLTVQDEPFDLASETSRGYKDSKLSKAWDKFQPNDGTPAIERRLRKQGFRKAEDSERSNVWEGYIELWTNGTPNRVHVLRQPSGDKLV